MVATEIAAGAPVAAMAVAARARVPQVAAPAVAMAEIAAAMEIAVAMAEIAAGVLAAIVIAAVAAISSADQWDPEPVAPVVAPASAVTAASTPVPRSAAGNLPAGIQVSI